jgi:hypothetical protein
MQSSRMSLVWESSFNEAVTSLWLLCFTTLPSIPLRLTNCGVLWVARKVDGP